MPKVNVAAIRMAVKMGLIAGREEGLKGADQDVGMSRGQVDSRLAAQVIGDSQADFIVMVRRVNGQEIACVGGLHVDGFSHCGILKGADELMRMIFGQVGQFLALIMSNGQANLACKVRWVNGQEVPLRRGADAGGLGHCGKKFWRAVASSRAWPASRKVSLRPSSSPIMRALRPSELGGSMVRKSPGKAVSMRMGSVIAGRFCRWCPPGGGLGPG